MTYVQLFSKELPGKHPCLCSFKNVCPAVKRVCHRCYLDGVGSAQREHVGERVWTARSGLCAPKSSSAGPWG